MIQSGPNHNGQLDHADPKEVASHGSREVRSFNQRPNNICHTVGRSAGRKKTEILTLTIHQINVTRVVDRVVGAVRRRNLGVIDFVGARDQPGRGRVTAQPDQAWMKKKDIVG